MAVSPATTGNADKIVFYVRLGLTTEIAATAICKAIKAENPGIELYVHPNTTHGVYVGNTHVNVLDNDDWKTNHFDRKNKEVKYLGLYPLYRDADFLAGSAHLIPAWCERAHIKYNGELPELFMSSSEQDVFGKQFRSQKPIMLIQTNDSDNLHPKIFEWRRDMPIATAQKVVHAFAKDYQIIHVRRRFGIRLPGVSFLYTEDFRTLAALIQMSGKRLFINSYLQHAAAALRKPSVVCVADDLTAKQFSYDMHTNIIANPPTITPEPKHFMRSKYRRPVPYPYHNEDEIYDADMIIDALER